MNEPHYLIIDMGNEEIGDEEVRITSASDGRAPGAGPSLKRNENINHVLDCFFRENFGSDHL